MQVIIKLIQYSLLRHKLFVSILKRLEADFLQDDQWSPTVQYIYAVLCRALKSLGCFINILDIFNHMTHYRKPFQWLMWWFGRRSSLLCPTPHRHSVSFVPPSAHSLILLSQGDAPRIHLLHSLLSFPRHYISPSFAPEYFLLPSRCWNPPLALLSRWMEVCEDVVWPWGSRARLPVCCSESAAGERPAGHEELHAEATCPSEQPVQGDAAMQQQPCWGISRIIGVAIRLKASRGEH